MYPPKIALKRMTGIIIYVTFKYAKVNSAGIKMGYVKILRKVSSNVPTIDEEIEYHINFFRFSKKS